MVEAGSCAPAMNTAGLRDCLHVGLGQRVLYILCCPFATVAITWGLLRTQKEVAHNDHLGSLFCHTLHLFSLFASQIFSERLLSAGFWVTGDSQMSRRQLLISKGLSWKKNSSKINASWY